ncbi:MAG: DotU family type IV/VI secretion system protein [Phycisphaerae bacterium]|nr:DotU family type IV/VI secretion system protein [Tepidisphaeraceae bacterium]
MQLTELCEPVFQYACLLNRSARKGKGHAPEQVRADVQGILARLRVQAQSDAKLGALYARAEPVLVYFLDATVRQSNLPYAGQWPGLAQEADGDEKFFDLLDDALRDPSRDAQELLKVFYTCLGLGFAGWYAGQPEVLRKRMLDIAAKVRSVTESVHASRIVPEAYEHVNTSNLADPPGVSLVGIGVVLVGLLAVLFAANVYLYRSSSAKLNDAIQQVLESGGTGATQPAAPATAPVEGSPQ